MAAIGEMDPTVVRFVDNGDCVIYTSTSPEQLAAIRRRAKAGEVIILPRKEAEKVVNETWEKEGWGRGGSVVHGSPYTDPSGVYGIE